MKDMIFPIGDPNDAYAEFFSGQSYLKVLSDKQVTIFNVTFEPGCRNNWHIHHADKGGGQILLVTAGRGWYQEWGKPVRELHPGDVVNSMFSHIAIEVPAVGGKNEWCEPVSDSEYLSLNNQEE